MKNTLLYIFLLLSIPIYGQSYHITQLDIEQGLSNNNVVSITQDKDGFLWFGTEEGLNKFDGSRFINYYKYTGHISGNELNDIYADPQEPIIWIATQRAGMNAYNYEEDKLTVFTHDENNTNSLITNDVTSIYPAADGNLWLSTYHHGIEYFNKATEEFTHYNISTLSGLTSNNIWTVVDDGNGSVYVGHVGQGMSIISLKDKRVRNFRHDPADKTSLPGDYVQCIYKDNNNNIWVGTNRGIALYNNENEQFVLLDNTPDSPLSSHIYDIRHLDDNKLWIGTELNGIYILDLKQHFFMSPGQLSLQHIGVGSNKYSLSNSTARSIFQDSFKNIWIGTYGGGINFISHTPPLFNAHHYSPIIEDKSSLNNRTVLSLATDIDNKLWVGTDGGGINVFDKGKRTSIYNEENRDISHNSVLSIYRDSQDNIWMGTFMAGVNCYDKQKKRFSPIQLNHLPDHDARCFHEDNNQDMWIGTNIGIFVVEIHTKGNVRHYTKTNTPLPDDIIRAITQSEEGYMWIGTFGQGLSIHKQDMEQVAHFGEYNGFCSNNINHLFKDSKGQIWVATGEGLACFPADGSLNFYVFGREEGLTNTCIRAITEDNSGNIWFSTNSGISCYVSTLNQIRNYNSLDKTPMGNFTNGAVTKDADGIIYFGTINGTRYFDPATVLTTRETPPIRITEMRIYEGQSIQKENTFMNLFNHKSILLTYKQNTFNIILNIQDYSFINSIEYTYRLKGLNDAWYTLDKNSVMFRNIPPGRYEFQAKARIHNQEWADQLYTLPIRITPPVWLSWWAKALYFIFALCILLFLLYTYKKRLEIQSSLEVEKKNHEQEQELNTERLRFYTNITHELRTPLTLILGPLEDLQKDQELQPNQLKKISVIHDSAIRLLNLINQILEFRKTETQNKKLCVSKGNLAVLVRETGLRYKELNRKEDIEMVIKVEQDPISLYFDKEVVTIILDNLISNAIKYTERGFINISLANIKKEDTEYAEIKIADTGYGISQEELSHIFDRYYQVKNEHQASGTGIGLSLVKNLVNLHEGEIRVESSPNKGTTFYFSLLMHNIYPNALHADTEKEEKKNKEEESITEKSSEELASDEKPILLVVEDNIEIREYISDSFSDAFEVITAGEGKAGCQAAFNHIPDIIVSDIMMPGMDGIAFCKIIKEDIRTSHIPIIMLTAKDSLQHKEEGYLAGADSYLTKPFSATLLRSRIYNLLEARKKLAIQLRSKIYNLLEAKEKTTVQFNPNLNNSKLNNTDKKEILYESLTQLDNEFMQQITQIVEENLEYEKMDIAYLCDKLCMSKSTLYRKIKALTGISTNEFVRKIKMQNAERLLLEGRHTISEIAFRVGINSVVYFRQCFKEEFGVSPSEYLKNLKKE